MDGFRLLSSTMQSVESLSSKLASNMRKYNSIPFSRSRLQSRTSSSMRLAPEVRTLPENGDSVVVENLVKCFGSFVAVDRINLEIRKGEVFGFLGPNGAGKSTTIRMLCGLLTPTEGRATVAGFDVASKPEAVRQNIGYMSQKFSLYNDLKVIENIRLFAGLSTVNRNELSGRIEWALQMANLKGQENLITGTLPGGWKQRLALGCAVLHKPPVIFLDEPTSGVDPISRRRFWELIHQMAGEGVTVFVTTHYMEEAEYCNRLALIFRGKIVALGLRHTTQTEFDERRVVAGGVRAPGHGPGGAGEELSGAWMLRSSAMRCTWLCRMRRRPIPRLRAELEAEGRSRFRAWKRFRHRWKMYLFR